MANKKAPMDKIASVKAMVEYLVNHPGEDVELDDLRLYVAKTAALVGFRPIGPQGIAATMCLIHKRSPLYAKYAPLGIMKIGPGVYHYTRIPEPRAEVPAAPKSADAQPSLFPESMDAPSALASIDKSLASIVKALWAVVDILKTKS
jgi:hypothetical protein